MHFDRALLIFIQLRTFRTTKIHAVVINNLISYHTAVKPSSTATSDKSEDQRNGQLTELLGKGRDAQNYFFLLILFKEIHQDDYIA